MATTMQPPSRKAVYISNRLLPQMGSVSHPAMGQGADTPMSLIPPHRNRMPSCLPQQWSTTPSLTAPLFLMRRKLLHSMAYQRASALVCHQNPPSVLIRLRGIQRKLIQPLPKMWSACLSLLGQRIGTSVPSLPLLKRSSLSLPCLRDRT